MERIAEELRRAPIFSSFNPRQVAQTVPYVSRTELRTGEILFKVGTPASDLHFVRSGMIELSRDDGEKTDEVSDGFVGEEAAVDLDTYQLEAVATEPTVILSIPQTALRKLLPEHPGAQLKFYQLLVNHFHRTEQDLPEGVETQIRKKKESKLSKSNFIGWWLALLFPLIVRQIALQVWGLDDQQSIFLMVLAAAIVMWMFTLVPEFIPGIFAIMSLLITGVAPSEVVLRGFASGSFFMALSLFALGSIIADSGLTYRLVLLISKYLPNRQFWYSFSILGNGLFLTPVLPSANGRVSLISTLVVDMVDALRLRPRGRAATYISFSAFIGVSLFSFVFLSSKSANFIVYGLLPAHVQHQYGWGYWLKASLVSGGVLLVLYLVFASLYFRNKEIPQVTRGQVRAQLNIIGPPTAGEVIAMASVLLFLVGILTSSIHKIALPWIGLAVLYLFLALGLMGKKDFQRKVDWSFLVLLGSLVGLSKAMTYLGLDEWLGDKLYWMGAYMRGEFEWFILILFVMIMLIRFALPNTATVALFATILIPLATVNGTNPWLVGVLILNFSDGWLLPYQCSYYLQFRDQLGPRRLYDEKKVLIANLVTTAMRLVVVYASLPYWRHLGIL